MFPSRNNIHSSISYNLWFNDGEYGIYIRMPSLLINKDKSKYV